MLTTDHAGLSGYRDIVLRSEEVGMVEHVRDHRHEIEMQPLTHAKAFCEAYAMRTQSRALQNINAAVAEPANARRTAASWIRIRATWNCVRPHVKPAIDGALVRSQIAVRDSVGKATERVGVGWIGTRENWREVLAGLQEANLIQLPAANDLVYGAWDVSEVARTASHRQVPS